jgi:two-component sensor histidine kinase
LGDHVDQMKIAVDEKNALAEELQHRVRNNLQLVHGMLSKLSSDVEGQPAQRGVNAVARRVTTLAEMYNRLLGTGMTRTADFRTYLTALCESLEEVQTSPERQITLTCECDPLELELETVTALGIIAAELIANSYEHAFPDGKGGRINVQGPCTSADGSNAELIIRDRGLALWRPKGASGRGSGWCGD